MNEINITKRLYHRFTTSKKTDDDDNDNEFSDSFAYHHDLLKICVEKCANKNDFHIMKDHTY